MLVWHFVHETTPACKARPEPWHVEQLPTEGVT